MTWSADGFESAFTDLCRQFDDSTFPDPPAGFTALSSPRPMRVVLHGSVPDPERAESAFDVVVKWHSAVRVGDHVSQRVRGGKGEREGTVLRALAQAGVRVPQVLGYARHPDVCVTAFRADFRSVTPPLSNSHVADVAEQLGKALGVGLDARDLHPGNLAMSDDGVTLVDMGSAAIAGAPSWVRMLARWRYSFGQHLSYAQRHRALRALLTAAGRDASDARALTPDIDAEAQRIAAKHRRGRDRRARRSGRHFDLVQAPDAQTVSPELRAGIRRRTWRGPSIEAAARTLLAGDISGQPLKADGSVLRVEDKGQTYVVKQYGSTPGLKPPRPLRTFRRAFALENRRVPVALAQMALTARDGSGVLISNWVAGRDLHAWFHDDSDQGYRSLPIARRHAVLTALGRMLRAMHDEGMTHRDLKAPNLLWHDDGTRAGRFTIVDVEGARVARKTISWKRRARDLARLDASLPARPTDRTRVLRAYRGVFPRAPIDEPVMAAWIERRVRHKRGPSGLPK